MAGVTTLDAKWLGKLAASLCLFGKPLENPPPRYDADKDAVLCWSIPTFGPHHWPLPALEIPFPRELDRFKYFARFLLEGLVCPPLAAFVVRSVDAVLSMQCEKKEE